MLESLVFESERTSKKPQFTSLQKDFALLA